MAASREWAAIEREMKGLFNGLTSIIVDDYCDFVTSTGLRDTTFEQIFTQNIVTQTESIFRFLEREAYEHQAEFKTEIQRIKVFSDTNVLEGLLFVLCTFPDQGIVWSTWELENSTFGNVLQWLPHETLSDTITLYSPFWHLLPDFLGRLSKLCEMFDMPAFTEEHLGSLLRKAVKCNNRTLIDFLIDRGAKLDVPASGDVSLLYVAIKHAGEGMQKFLLDRAARHSSFGARNGRDEYALAFLNVNSFFSNTRNIDSIQDSFNRVIGGVAIAIFMCYILAFVQCIMALLSDNSNSQPHLPGPGFGR